MSTLSMETLQSPVKTGFTLRKADLEAVILFASTNPARYQLNSVYMDTKSLVATDGKRLLLSKKAIVWDNGVPALDRGIIIPLAAAKMFVKMTDKKQSDVSLSLSFIGMRAVVTHTASGYSVNALEGKYPDYKQVLPKFENPAPSISVIEAKFYVDACKAFKLITGDKSQYNSVTFQNYGGQDYNNPAVFNNELLTMVIMPLRQK